jgi:hypothetical protein
MSRVSLRLLWPCLILPAVLLVLLMLVLMTGRSGPAACSAHDGQRVTTLGNQCALLLPSR